MQQQEKVHLKECAMQLLSNVCVTEIGSYEFRNSVDVSY